MSKPKKKSNKNRLVKPKAEQEENGHGRIASVHSAFQQGSVILLKPLQMELVHYCGDAMTIFLDGNSPEDQNYRTWAWCKRCRQMSLIHEGKWADPKILSDTELFSPTGSVQ